MSNLQNDLQIILIKFSKTFMLSRFCGTMDSTVSFLDGLHQIYSKYFILDWFLQLITNSSSSVFSKIYSIKLQLLCLLMFILFETSVKCLTTLFNHPSTFFEFLSDIKKSVIAFII